MKKYIWKLLRFLNIAPFIMIFYKGILDEYGWLKSFNKMQAINREGKPIPWFTYSAIDFLKDRLTEKMIVFEFGSGNSTLWFSQRVKNIVSVEHDIGWYDKVKKEMPDNAKLIHCNLDYDGEYCRTVFKQGIKFNIIIIDGRDRNNCVNNSIDNLTEDGVIIFDNTDRTSYSEGIQFLLNNGFKKIAFKGLIPANAHSGETTIFYRKNNCLEI